MSAEQTIELNGKTYPMLADGQYDCIILGTGLKECMLAGLLSKKGMKVNVKCFHYPVGDGFRFEMGIMEEIARHSIWRLGCVQLFLIHRNCTSVSRVICLKRRF